VSRRRGNAPAARHDRGLAKRRVKFFCTGRSGAPHGPHKVGEYYMRDAGRADLDSCMAGAGNTPGWEIGPGGRVLPLLPCDRCAEPRPQELPFDAVQKILDEMPAGTVIRWDISTWRVLTEC
jgi:hypothetical protein